MQQDHEGRVLRRKPGMRFLNRLARADPGLTRSAPRNNLAPSSDSAPDAPGRGFGEAPFMAREDQDLPSVPPAAESCQDEPKHEAQPFDQASSSSLVGSPMSEGVDAEAVAVADPEESAAQISNPQEHPAVPSRQSSLSQTQPQTQDQQPPPSTTPAQQTAANANQYSIANIFQCHKWKPMAGQVRPRLNETQPLSLYFHAGEHPLFNYAMTQTAHRTALEENLMRAIRALKNIRNTASDAFRRKTEKVHRAQRLMLDTIYLIYIEIDDEFKASREYRRQLPPEDQRELEGGFSENILFAAQALSKGFRIRGIEQFTNELVEPAKELCASIDAVKFVFRNRAMLATPVTANLPSSSNYAELAPVISDFDRYWTAFEQKICFCYFSVTYSGRPGRIDETDMFQVLMSETIIRAISLGLITLEDIQCLDPSTIIAVPRLTILMGLVHMPGAVCMTEPETAFRWFRAKSRLLRDLQLVLVLLTDQEVRNLEILMCGDAMGNNVDKMEDKNKIQEVRLESGCRVSMDGGTRDKGKSPEQDGETAVEKREGETSSSTDKLISRLFVAISSVADEIARSKEFVAMMQRVFLMHSHQRSPS